MKTEKRLLSYSEKYERITFTRKSTGLRPTHYCVGCGKAAEWLTLPDVSMVTGKSPEVITQMIMGNEFHFLIDESGQFFVCADSLIKGL